MPSSHERTNAPAPEGVASPRAAPISPQGAGAHIASAVLRQATSGPQAALQAALQQLAALPPDTWLECGRSLLQEDAAPAAAFVLERAVQRWPEQVELRYWLANARRMAGDRAGAERLLREVLVRQPGHEDAALSLAFLLRDWARFSAAAEVAIGLCRRQGGGVEASKRCVRFLKECRREELADAFCEEALAGGSDDPVLLSFAGSLCMSLGRFERAREHFEHILRLRPKDTEPLFCMALIRRYESADHPDFARLRAALEDSTIAQEERALAGFGLGKALDDVGHYAEAAAVFRRANAALKPTVRWDAQAWRRFVDGNSQLRLPRLVQPVDSSIVPVFVVGLPRTGTTLVADRLSRRPQVRNRDELNWIEHVYRELAAGPLDQRRLANAAAMCLAFLREDDAPARWYIDKNPLNFRHLNLIDALFPNARIIHCRRNLRDTALSIWMQRFSHEDNDYSYDFATIRSFAAGYEQLVRALVPGMRVPIMDVDYDELASQPDATLARLQAFLGLPAEPGIEQAGDVITTASVWQVRQPVYQRSIRRWLRYQEHLPEMMQLPESASELQWPDS